MSRIVSEIFSVKQYVSLKSESVTVVIQNHWK